MKLENLRYALVPDINSFHKSKQVLIQLPDNQPPMDFTVNDMGDTIILFPTPPYPGRIWDHDTNVNNCLPREYVPSHRVFKSFGELVDPQDVPALVRAGRQVWSYGYGMDFAPDEFTTIDLDDLWAWGDLSEVEGTSVIASWAPFRVAPK